MNEHSKCLLYAFWSFNESVQYKRLRKSYDFVVNIHGGIFATFKMLDSTAVSTGSFSNAVLYGSVNQNSKVHVFATHMYKCFLILFTFARLYNFRSVAVLVVMSYELQRHVFAIQFALIMLMCGVATYGALQRGGYAIFLFDFWYEFLINHNAPTKMSIFRHYGRFNGMHTQWKIQTINTVCQ